MEPLLHELREQASLTAAVALLGLCLGLAWGPRLRRPAQAPSAPSPGSSAAAEVLDASFVVRLVAPAPAEPRQPSPLPVEPVAERAPSTEQAQAAASLDPGSLRALLAAQGGHPLADKFAAEFRAEPSLMRIWGAYEKDGDFTGMVVRLRGTPKFQRLLGSYSRYPEFMDSLNALLVDARVKRAMRQAEARIGPSRP